LTLVQINSANLLNRGKLTAAVFKSYSLRPRRQKTAPETMCAITFFSKTRVAKKFRQEPKFPNRTFYVGYKSET